MAQFYGFSLEEMSRLKAYEVSEHWLAIDVIEAQNAITQLRILSYPHQKPRDQKQYFDFLWRKAYPNQEKKFVKVEDFVNFANKNGG